MKKPELLSPAGDMEKLKFAVHYGADAVYLGGSGFGLRAKAGNFTESELAEAVNFAHEKNVKVYVTVNVFPRNRDIDSLPEYIKYLEYIGADAVIVSDPGVFISIREISPNMEIHISTQANIMNWKSALFWEKKGAERIILSRELTIDEIKTMKQKVNIELEAFVHGSMCLSYSGRCYLSHYLSKRDANMGECTQPCRWKYAIVEEKRPGEYYPIEEDASGTYIMNSKDLCMIEHIPSLIEGGITSFKIEGRMKSAHYVATITKAYRQAIDQYCADPKNYDVDPAWLNEIKKTSHRPLSTGFYFEEGSSNSQIDTASTYIRRAKFAGRILDYDDHKKMALVEQRNRIEIGDRIEIFGPKTQPYLTEVKKITDIDGNFITAVPHPQMKYFLQVDRKFEKNSLLRLMN